jgi:hypothetical protein
MITRLGATSNAPYQSNAGLAWDNVTSWLANLGASAKYGTIPDATKIVPYPGAPSTQDQMITPGAWTPEMAAAQGLANAKSAQTALISQAEAGGSWDPTGNYWVPNAFAMTGLSDIPWGTIAIAGACILGVVVILPMLGRGR